MEIFCTSLAATILALTRGARKIRAVSHRHSLLNRQRILKCKENLVFCNTQKILPDYIDIFKRSNYADNAS